MGAHFQMGQMQPMQMQQMQMMNGFPMATMPMTAALHANMDGIVSAIMNAEPDPAHTPVTPANDGDDGDDEAIGNLYTKGGDAAVVPNDDNEDDTSEDEDEDYAPMYGKNEAGDEAAKSHKTDGQGL